MGRDKTRGRRWMGAEPLLGRLAIVTGMCQESLLGALVPGWPTPEIAGGSEGSSSTKIRGAGRSVASNAPTT
jgi:hypothetical protein